MQREGHLSAQSCSCARMTRIVKVRLSTAPASVPSRRDFRQEQSRAIAPTPTRTFFALIDGVLPGTACLARRRARDYGYYRLAASRLLRPTAIMLRTLLVLPVVSCLRRPLPSWSLCASAQSRISASLSFTCILFSGQYCPVNFVLVVLPAIWDQHCPLVIFGNALFTQRCTVFCDVSLRPSPFLYLSLLGIR